jgi:hypothetical protein
MSHVAAELFFGFPVFLPAKFLLKTETDKIGSSLFFISLISDW